MKMRNALSMTAMSVMAMVMLVASGRAQTAAAPKAATAHKSIYHDGDARGPIRAVDLTTPLGKDVSSEIVAGPNSGLESAYLIYTRMPAGSHGPAMYTMPVDHTYMVLSGKMNIQLGTDKFVADPETVIVVPAGIPSTVWNAGTDPVAALEVVIPAPSRNLTAMMKPATAHKIENAAQYVKLVKPIADPSRGTNPQPFVARATDPELMSHLQERIDNAKPGFGVGPGLHVHGFDQIYFELQGNMTLQYGLASYTVQPNSFCIIPAGVVHYNKNEGSVVERHVTLLLGEPEKEPFDLPVEFKAPRRPPTQ